MPYSFQHPYDDAATRALEATPGLDMLRRIVTGVFIEKLHLIKYTGHCARVDETQYPSLFRRFRQIAERLDIRRLPELYIKPDPQVNAYAQGTDTYFVVLHTGLLDIMSEEELEVVLAHELGHVKCDHMKHMSTVGMLKDVGPQILQLANIPVAPAILMAAQVAMVNWYQKAEFSADRAALLGVQDCELVQGALAKLAGFSSKHTEKMNIESLKRQARRHEEFGDKSFFERALKVIVMLQLDHPALVERILEIEEWGQSRAYKRIIEGEYESDQPAVVGPFCKICPNGHIQPVEALFCGIDGYNLRDVPVVPTPHS